MNTIIEISASISPAYVGFLLERLQNRRHKQGEEMVDDYPPMPRAEAVHVLGHLAVLCDDPKARVFFKGLYESLK
jgi:hypothetical protein